MFNEMRYSDYHERISWELKDAIRRYFDLWEEIIATDEAERETWAKCIEQRRLTVVVLSSALLESAINFYLCLKCDTKEFRDIQWGTRFPTLYDRCTAAPKLFQKNYFVAKNSDLAKDLQQLIRRRNAIVHPNPMLSIDGDNRHKGNEPVLLLDEHEFLGRCATLPFRLVEHLIGNQSDCLMEMWSMHVACGRVAHAFEAGQRRLEIEAKFPRELIKEIMGQGHDRDTAVLCAILMGEKPKIDHAGNIRIFVRLGKEIVLTPLKFHTKKRKSTE